VFVLFQRKSRAFFSSLPISHVASHIVRVISVSTSHSARKDQRRLSAEARERDEFLSFRSMAITRRSHHRSLLALSLLLLVLFLSVSTAKKQEKSSRDDAVDLAGSAVIDWIRDSGGHSDVRVGLVVDAPAGAEPTSVTKKNKRQRRRRGKKEGSSALRGTIATRDIAAGEVIIRLPSNLSVPLGGTGVTSPVRRAEGERTLRLSFSLLFLVVARRSCTRRFSLARLPLMLTC